MDRNYILAALNKGFRESQIADSLGVSQSAVSQFIDAHQLRDKAVKNEEFNEIDSTYNRIEKKLAKKMEQQLEYSVLNPMQLGKLIKDVNSLRRRSTDLGDPAGGNNVQLVNIQLPERSKLTMSMSQTREILEVGGRTFQTLQSGKLQGIIDESSKKKLEIQDIL